MLYEISNTVLNNGKYQSIVPTMNLIKTELSYPGATILDGFRRRRSGLLQHGFVAEHRYIPKRNDSGIVRGVRANRSSQGSDEV